MSHYLQYTPPTVRTLIDHLDAVLAGCDSLQTAQNAAASSHDLLRLELTVIAHALQARESMKELAAVDGALSSQVVLFLTVTSCLEEAGSADATALLEAASTCLIGGRIPVATLVALTTAMRDFVELCFVIGLDARADAPIQPSTRVSEALIWATGPDCT
jgi:hypothetical protein